MGRRAWAIASWVFWLSWMAVAVVVELFTVFSEKKRGTLPLTRVVRDRLMRKSAFAKFGVLLFLGWIVLHFLTGGGMSW